LSAVREQGSPPTPLRDAPAWEKNVYEAEVGARAGSALAQEIGKSFSGHERNRLFFSCLGKDFKDLSAIAGLDNPADGRVLSLWDYDRDGRQDFAVVNANAPLLNIYRNEVPSPGKVIAVRFVGANTTSSPDPTRSSRDGYGAKVRVKVGSLSLLREYRCGEGMAAQNSSTLLIGIGAHDRAESVLVTWPSGRTQEIAGVEAGTAVTFYENPAEIAVGSNAAQLSAMTGVTKEPYLLASAPGAATEQPGPITSRLFPKVKGVKADKGLRLYTTMATWCASCKAHLPELRQLRDSFGPADGLSMYGLPVDAGDDAAKLNSYEAKFQPAYELLTEIAPTMERVKQSLKEVDALEGLPSTVVTDHRGRVLLSTPGLPTVSQLRFLLGPDSSPRLD
jgi:hypothetical protein